MKNTTALLKHLVVCLLLFSTAAVAQVADEFTAPPLNAMWSFLNPVADGGTATVNGTTGELEIVVPAGTEHQVLAGGNNAARVMQAVSSPASFTIAVKFTSGVILGQEQGIQIWQDDANLLRLEFYGDGTSTYVLQAGITAGVYAQDVAQSIGIPGIFPLYMKIDKSADSWSLSYSTDGIGWTPYPNFNPFTNAMTVNGVGIYGGNYGAPAPAFTGKFDYFQNLDPLPIQLASFSATLVSSNHVRIDWSTLSETNNFGFYIQKAQGNSTSFVTIPNSFVEGHGTTISPHSYSYLDATATAGVWQYRLEQIDLDGTRHYTEPVQVNVVTGVSERKLVPTEFALQQNFPNPFNPSTKITFDVPKESRVKLEVYNLIGQNVATLLDEVKPAGRHTVEFNARSLTSGVYLYKLNSAGITFTKKMVLMK